MDVLTPEQRQRNMSRIRGKDTRPEMIVRRLLHNAGYRYRLHRRDLPGKPDLVFVSRRSVVLVHGCFWHRHSCRYGRVKPHTNATFWENKISENVARDRRNRRALRAAGWHVLTIWECETKDRLAMEMKLREFLDR
jgi:DNA mismatch endonuclease, patch repair protein